MPLTPFHSTVSRWFHERIGAPSEPQVAGWPRIARGEHTLIAAPTGTGKTLAAFLWAIDGLLRTGEGLRGRDPRALRVAAQGARQRRAEEPHSARSPSSARLDPSLPEVRVLVRTGDTPPSERTRDDEAAAAHPRHHARVALHPAHERGRARDAPHGPNA